MRAIANEIDGSGAHARAGDLVVSLERKHAEIAHMFGSGAGLALQRRDSEMTESILLRLIAQGAVALPIHDSFIATERAKGALMEAMAAELGNAMSDLGQKNSVLSTSYAKSDLQYGEDPSGSGVVAGGPPVGLVVVIFPEQRQRDFFGAHSLSVSAAAILGWHGGVAPPEVRRALRHEIRRRGHRHLDVANRIGISRPQFANILQGRFGASPKVAGRIRDFLVEGAKTVGGA